MAWVRLDDHIDEHPKIVVLDDHAFALFVKGLAYCNRNLTDGFIPAIVAKQKMGARRLAIAALESVGLWEAVAGGWQVHDFSVYQPTRQQVEEERSKKQAAGQAGGRASAIARAQAPASGVVEAKVKPVPDPVPVPVKDVRPFVRPSKALGAASISAVPPEVAERLSRPPIGTLGNDERTNGVAK